MDSFLDLSLETSSWRPSFPQTRCSLLGRLVKLSSVLSSDLDDVESSRGPSCWAKSLSQQRWPCLKTCGRRQKLTSPPRKFKEKKCSCPVLSPSFLTERHLSVDMRTCPSTYFKRVQLYGTKTTLEQCPVSAAFL